MEIVSKLKCSFFGECGKYLKTTARVLRMLVSEISTSVSQSVSYFTVPPRAHPSTGSQSGSATPGLTQVPSTRSRHLTHVAFQCPASWNFVGANGDYITNPGARITSPRRWNREFDVQTRKLGIVILPLYPYMSKR